MGFRFLLDSGLHLADAVTEAPAAREVDDAAPLVTAEGPAVWRQLGLETWMPREPARVSSEAPGLLSTQGTM